MNISKAEQRVLHVLAQGGHIRHERGSGHNGSGRKITKVVCFTRDGHVLSDCTPERVMFGRKHFRVCVQTCESALAVFARLRRRRLIASAKGGPYRATRLGRISVRAQLDNR